MFAELTWDDLADWAGDRIVSRGKGYQSKGRVRDPAVTEDGGLVAWVDGTQRYAVKVVMMDDGLLAEVLDSLEGVPVIKKQGR